MEFKALKLLPIFIVVAISGCENTPISSSINSSFFSYSSSEMSSDTLSSISNSTTSKSSSDNSSSSSLLSNSISSIYSSSSAYSSSSKISSYSSSNSSVEKIRHLGTLSIAEVREYCSKITGLNSFGIGVDMLTTVTIKGLAYGKIDLVKSTSKYGLNISSPNKIFFADSTGSIACASTKGNEGTTLWGKAQGYVGQTTSKYEVTGYLSMYLGQPELYVPEKTFSWNQNLDIKVDYPSLVKEKLSLNSYYERACAIQYNCAGHGYSEIYKVEKIKCYSHKDDVYYFTDGNSLMKVIKRTASFVEGKTYDVIGYISTSNYSPALNALEAKLSSEEVSNIEKQDAVVTSINDLKKIKTSQDDTNERFDSFITSFKSLRKATVYASYYVINGKYYVTVSDDFDTGTVEISNRATAHTAKGMVDITNDNYWNVTWEEIVKFCPIGYYVNGKISFDIYYSGYQLEYSSKKPLWKIYAFNEFLDPIPNE